MTKTYNFDFYLVKCTDEDGKNINFSDILDLFKQQIISTHALHKGYKRDIYNLFIADNIYTGQIRKLRESDLPEVGAIGTAATPLNLPQGQGVLERNCFLYDQQNAVLVWQNNIHGCTPKIFESLVTVLSGYSVNFYPILRRDVYTHLMNNQAIRIKDLDVSVARPTNPHQFEANEPISEGLLNMLENTGADKLNLKLSADLRRSDSSGFLSAFSLSSIGAILNLQPTKARITVIDDENDVQYPIDLITDRLRNRQIIQTKTLVTIPANVILDAAVKAYREMKGEINEIFDSIP